MSIGSFHTETGLLLHQRGGFILQLDSGGRWRLEATGNLEELLGKRVRVEGFRSGFDSLEVSRVAPV